jgi:hypothetical protein
MRRVRQDLVERLHARSDDFAATEELRTLSSELRDLGSHGDPSDPRRLADGGLSFFDRLRARRERRRARRARA